MDNCLNRIGNHVEVHDISGGGAYCSHWGVSDLYPECEKKLRHLIDAHEDFMTEWCGSKKELLSVRYGKVSDMFSVEVNAWMDDLWDGGELIYDAIDDVLHDSSYGISDDRRQELETIANGDGADEYIGYIKDLAFEVDVQDSVFVCDSMPASEATYERVMQVAEKLSDDAEGLLKQHYSVLCCIVANAVM